MIHTYLRLFLGQLRDGTVPLRERWVRAHRMAWCGYLISRGRQIKKSHIKWIEW